MMRAAGLAWIWILTLSAGQAADLSVRITGIETRPGVIVARLFASERGFPSDPAAAIAEGRSAISGGTAALFMSGLAPGRYAMIAVHDENADGVMEKTFLGLPEEGYGLSNNPRPLLVPRFADGVFEIKDGQNAIEVALVYY